jgi:sugar phosphate isomerase/epimerase
MTGAIVSKDPKSLADLKAKNPRGDRPFRIGACLWTINNGNTRFQLGGRQELSDTSTVQKIAYFKKANDEVARRAPLLEGVSMKGITGVEGHYPNEINRENFKELVAALKANGLVMSMVTPNLFYTFSRSSFMSRDNEERNRAIQWAKDTVDLAYMYESEFGHLPTGVYWPGGEGQSVRFGAEFVDALHLYAGAFREVMEYEATKGGRMLFAFEAKPNEPQANIILPTSADFLAVMNALLPPEFSARVGVNPETAHEMLANLSPINPVSTAIALGKLFHYHANFQEGLKWDMDLGVPFNMAMLEVVKAMKEYEFRGYIGLDMQARPESKDVTSVMVNSVMNLRLLEFAVGKIDWYYVDMLRKEGTPENVEEFVSMSMNQALPRVDPKVIFQVGKK